MPDSRPVGQLGGSPETVQKAAIISGCGRYRYTLERSWNEGNGTVLFMMLNPSTADASVDDPTIRRCMGFARSWGYSTLVVWNLYAYRATNPAELARVDDPIGRDNYSHLWRLLPEVDLVVAAWGAKPNHGRYTQREARVIEGLHDVRVRCLGLTKGGHPRHPLYVRGDAPLIPFDLGERHAAA